MNYFCLFLRNRDEREEEKKMRKLGLLILDMFMSFACKTQNKLGV